jgi:hypothetical protein
MDGTVIVGIAGHLLEIGDTAFLRVREGWRTVDYLKHSHLVLSAYDSDGRLVYLVDKRVPHSPLDRPPMREDMQAENTAEPGRETF